MWFHFVSLWNRSRILIIFPCFGVKTTFSDGMNNKLSSALTLFLYQKGSFSFLNKFVARNISKFFNVYPFCTKLHNSIYILPESNLNNSNNSSLVRCVVYVAGYDQHCTSGVRSGYGIIHATIVARSDLVGPSTLSTVHSEINDTNIVQYDTSDINFQFPRFLANSILPYVVTRYNDWFLGHDPRCFSESSLTGLFRNPTSFLSNWYWSV
jgi:hypothetical protein